MNAFDGIISRLHSWRKNLWGRRHIHIKGKRTKTEKQGLCIQGLRGNHRRCDMCNGNTRGDERKKQKIFETIRTENFPKLTPNTKPQIQEAERTSTRISANVLHLDISVRYTENEKGKPWKKPEGKSKKSLRRAAKSHPQTFHNRELANAPYVCEKLFILMSNKGQNISQPLFGQRFTKSEGVKCGRLALPVWGSDRSPTTQQ